MSMPQLRASHNLMYQLKFINTSYLIKACLQYLNIVFHDKNIENLHHLKYYFFTKKIHSRNITWIHTWYLAKLGNPI